MKIVIDDKIPFIRGVFEENATVLYQKGTDISPEDIADADAMIVRTRTLCNEKLLKGSKVKLIATATIGYDHIDTDYCEKNNIKWTNCAGCNAASVAQYISSAISVLKEKYNWNLSEKTIGIIGVGNVGKLVKKIAENLGMKILINDPPREMTEGNKTFSSLDEICDKADIVTFHTPLILDGTFKTHHIANANFFDKLKRKPFIINAARGEIMDTQATITAIKKNIISGAIIDCWENEPEINRELLNLCELGTPHIAGYSADGKANATYMAIKAINEFFELKTTNINKEIIPKPENTEIENKNVFDAIIASYDIRTDSERLKNDPENFENLRGNYPLRREFQAFSVKNPDEYTKKLGFK